MSTAQQPDPTSTSSTASGTPEDSAPQDSLATRGDTRSRQPRSAQFHEFMTEGWAPAQPQEHARLAVADFTESRRTRLGSAFTGSRLVIPAGTLVRRSNDTDYRFRPHSAFAHLTGLGTDREPDAVLVLHPRTPEASSDAAADAISHDAVLYLRPLAPRSTSEFYADSRYGEFWVGARPTLEDIAHQTGITTAHIDDLADALAKDVGADGVSLLVVRDSDEHVEALVDAIRATAGLDTTETGGVRAAADDANLTTAVSELRLIKDSYEIAELRAAVAATIDGFAQVARSLPHAVTTTRGERVIETTFDSHARLAGNAVGYETIAASGNHATTLHWIRNDGPVHDGDLVLVDAGVEVESLYTADITRTLPVSGTFNSTQREIYQAVLDAADAAFAVARPGNRFRDVHAAAMEVIADRLAGWGLLPGSAADSLAEEGQQHRRWMVHGTSHHLGLDVHDCAQARRELYLDAIIEPGMVFTIEPGLYFKDDDLRVPAEFRGIGIRIEDDVLVLADGNENLSAALPRRPEDVEAWLASLRD